jgi:hypothetical protein
MLIEFDPRRSYGYEDLEDMLGHIELATPADFPEHPPVPNHKQWRELMEKWWGKFDHRTKKMLLSSEVPDRSLHLARLAKAMAAISIPPQEIFGILSNLSTNKFYKRPEVLWKSVVLTAGVNE